MVLQKMNNTSAMALLYREGEDNEEEKEGKKFITNLHFGGGHECCGYFLSAWRWCCTNSR